MTFWKLPFEINGKIWKVTPFETFICHNKIMLWHLNVPNGVTDIIFAIYFQWEFSKCHNRFFGCVCVFSAHHMQTRKLPPPEKLVITPPRSSSEKKRTHGQKHCYDILKTLIWNIWVNLDRLLHLGHLYDVTRSCYDI